MPPPTATLFDHHVEGTGEANLDGLLAALMQSEAGSFDMGLDLSRFDRGDASHRRLSPRWLHAVANLVLGQFSEVPLRVTMPRERSARLQLMRSTFYYSLAQRQGRVEIDNLDNESQCLFLESKRSWSPPVGPVLFAEADGARLAERSYLFANTHERAGPGYFQRYQASAAFPSVGELIPEPVSAVGNEVRQMFIVATCEALTEVLDNFSRHAFDVLDPEFLDTRRAHKPVDWPRSCLMVSTTTGGRDSHDRLYFLATDNGYGIPRTMRWKHRKALQDTSAAEVIECILRRRLTEREIAGHNGAGLWSLRKLARFAGGSITVTSEDDMSSRGTATQVELTVPPISDEDTRLDARPRHVDVPWHGTTIHVQLRIPRIHDMDEDQLVALRDRMHEAEVIWPQAT